LFEATVNDILIRELKPDDLPAALEGLVDLLHATVHGGASVGFILPFSSTDSQRFWEDKIFPALDGGRRLLFVAETGGRIVGTVQLDIDLFPNQAHRGEVVKLLVHPDCRRRGIARKLMVVLERRARELGRSLLTLDTRTGDTAEPLYRSLSYETAGIIPDYCRAPESDRLDSTTYMYKAL